VDEKWRLERLSDLPGDGRGSRQVGRREREDSELVAAESRDGVSVAQAADEALGDELEQHVAVLMAERVVDVLELVEIHDEHRQ